MRRDSPEKPRPARRRPLQAPGLQDLAERLSDQFDTRVKVELGQRKGRIVVEFGSVEDFGAHRRPHAVHGRPQLERCAHVSRETGARPVFHVKRRVTARSIRRA